MATATGIEITPEDLLNIRDRPMPELVDGELAERVMGQQADAIAMRIGRFLGAHVDSHDLGLVNGAQGSYQIFPDQPNKVRIPDVSFTRKARLPEGGPAEGHGRVAPDLVVEVISPNDLASELLAKINDFLAAGIPLIWVADPDAASIQVYRGNGTGQLLQAGDSIDGEDILPGFRCEVARIFA